jgi:hypothetical protein
MDVALNRADPALLNHIFVFRILNLPSCLPIVQVRIALRMLVRHIMYFSAPLA